MVKSAIKPSIFGNIEYHEVEGIPLRKYGSLLVEEVMWFEALPDAQLTNLKKVAELAHKIAVNESIAEKDAIALVENFGDEANRVLMLKYADDLSAIQGNTYTQSSFNRDVALYFLNRRVPKKWLKDNAAAFEEVYDLTFDPENVQFTEASIKKLPEKVISGVVSFVANEKSEWAEVSVNQTSEDDQSLGK